MKIGLILAKPPGYSETFLRSKIMGLQKSGLQVVLFCNQKAPKRKFLLCPVKYRPKVSKRPFFQFFYFFPVFLGLIPFFTRVQRFVKLQKEDGIHGFTLIKSIYLNAHLLKAKVDWLHFGFATMVIGSEAVAKSIHAKMGVSFRGFDMGTFPVKNSGCYDRLWKYVDKAHTNSYDLWNNARHFGMPDSIRVEKITPAIDVRLFQSTEKPDDSLETPVFMTTGRLHWKKGYVQILEALAMLKKEGISFRYWIVGEGDDYERIAYAAYELGLKEDVEFFGKTPHTEVKYLLEKADIYIQYSIQEGFCNAVLEAQAMGKLCVVSDAEGLSENVEHKFSGWVVPKHAPEKLASRLKKVLKLSEEEKEKIKQNAIRRVQEGFTIAQQQEKFLKFFEVEDS